MASSSEMRTCRTIGHSWDTTGASKESRSAYTIQLRCDRCGAIRSDVIDSHGFLSSRYYQYPDHYRDADISDGTRDDKRAWLLKELLQAQRKVVPLKRKAG